VTTPFVSVVMPTYNHAQYIGEAIQSVLGQTYTNIELIIVDNFSTDNTRNIISDFADQRIRYLQFANHGIIAASRNHGIGHAKGKYIAFMDSDDLWEEEKLTMQVKLAQMDERIGLVFTRFCVMSEDNDNGKIMGPKRNFSVEDIYGQLIKNNFITSSSVLARRDAVERLKGFDENPDLRCSEDFDLWLRIAREYKVGFVPEVLDRLKKALNVIEKHEQKKWVTPSQASRAKINFIIQVAWFMIASDPQRAREYFQQAISNSKGSFKICAISLTALVMSYLPTFYHFIRRRNLDKKLLNMITNPQNL